MCLFHDFSELDLTKVSMIKVVPKMKFKVVTKVVIEDWDFCTLAHLLLIILWGLKVSWTQSAKSDLSCDQNARRTREIDATYATVA